VAIGGHAARERRHLLLPVLHAIQARVGWISRPALEYACRRLSIPPADAYGVATFYGLFSTTPRPPIVAHVCDDIACRLAGAEDVCADLERALGPAGEPALDGEATWLRSPCLGRCERAPAALFTVAGTVPETIAAAPVDAAGIVTRLERTAAGRRLVPAPTDTEPNEERLANVRRSVPQAGGPGLRILRRVGVTDPRSLDDYLATGGYRGLRRAIQIGRDAVIAEVTASGLLGRGGAAFPTGRKWAAVVTLAGRGFDAHISTEYDTPLPASACVYCGNCIGVCPTGALMFRSEHEMRAAGTWDEAAQSRTDTICPYCGVGCTLTLHVQQGAIVKVTSPLDASVTEGHLCVKGRFGFTFVGSGE
jgi:NADH:ubiquinone oxidoreductase subunit E/ferredoxin